MHELPSFDAIIFDLDGTLIDNQILPRTFFVNSFKVVDIKITEELLLYAYFLSKISNTIHPSVFLACYLKRSYFKIKRALKTFYTLNKSYFAHNYEKHEPKKDLLSFLNHCHKLTIPYGILTNQSKKNALIWLNNNVEFTITNLICLDDVTKGKPDPNGFLKMKKALKSQMPLLVGDGWEDLWLAKNTNCPFAFVNNGFFPLSVFSDYKQYISYFLPQDLHHLKEKLATYVNYLNE